MAYGITPLSQSPEEQQSVNGLTYLIANTANHDIDKRRDAVMLTKGGIVSWVKDLRENRLSTSTDMYSKASLFTTDRNVPVYQSKCLVEMSIRLGFETVPGDAYAHWGLFTEKVDEACYFGIDQQGLFICVAGNKEKTKVYREDWNKDSLDNLDQGRTLDFTVGHTYKIQITNLPYEPINFYISIQNSVTKEHEEILVHSYINQNFSSKFSKPLPITVTLSSGRSGQGLEMFEARRALAYESLSDADWKQTSIYSRRTKGRGNKSLQPFLSIRKLPISKGSNVWELSSLGIQCAGRDSPLIRITGRSSLTNAVWKTPIGYQINKDTLIQYDENASRAIGGDILASFQISQYFSQINFKDFNPRINIDRYDLITFSTIADVTMAFSCNLNVNEYIFS